MAFEDGNTVAPMLAAHDHEGINSLSIVIPAYNEAVDLPLTLRKIADYLFSRQVNAAEVVVVDDGSDDGTSDAAGREEETLHRVGATLRIIQNPVNMGKGYSVRRGMREAIYERVLCTDVDLSAPIQELDKLLSVSRERTCDVVIGSRALDRSLIGVRQPLWRDFSGRVFHVYVGLLTGLTIADTQCGFKLFNHGAAKRVAAFQRVNGFGFDVEQLVIARKMGFSVVEIPVRWNHNSRTSVTLFSGLMAFVQVLQVCWNCASGQYDGRE